MLTDDQVRHVAKLARIDLTDEEVKKFGGQMSKVLDYMDILKEVDTDKIKGTSQVTGLENVLGEDRVRAAACPGKDLIGATELPVDSEQIRVKKAI